MLKQIIYIITGLMLFSACESIYEPGLDVVENVLVADARLIYGRNSNNIILKKSRGFNDDEKYEPVSDATIFLTDDAGLQYTAFQSLPGVYTLTQPLDSLRQYQLTIQADDEIYVSAFEPVPPIPDIDTLYCEDGEQWIQPGGETTIDDFEKLAGQQFYVDMESKDTPKYYRFTARKIVQYIFPFDTILFGMEMEAYKYGWKTFYSQGLFNIAGPAEYTSKVDIVKHPVEFFRYTDQALIGPTSISLGWIYIMYQYGLTQSAYNFYKDLNSQLGSDGKIFDPLYVQARNNFKCLSTPGKVILGNFEIATYREHRYYVKLNRFSGNHRIRPITVYHDIPPAGLIPFSAPWFWEY